MTVTAASCDLCKRMERRPLGLGKRLVTDRTLVAPLFLTVDRDIAFPDLPTCQTFPIRAEYHLRVHWICFLAHSEPDSASVPSFLQVYPRPRFPVELPPLWE